MIETAYNPLGLLGPLNPRPEYRPPEKKEDPSPGASSSSGQETQRQSQATPVEAAKLRPEKGLNLAGAKALTASVTEAISQLKPEAVNTGPHRLNPYWGLYGSRYV
ncbi:MAG: hypothetical protein LBS60_12395 [Deltaproteobacteria bacterium]|jgi:hypothetical protein|nr:hypothetical protein [Deltaproteobacteria bacterium]